MLRVTVIAGTGSSPLTRGKPAREQGGQDVGRLIPAHAGKTCVGMRSTRRRRAHPRSRGENMPCPSPAWTQPGSSPLTRGKRNRWGSSENRSRLIPAHAGKTSWTSRTSSRAWAHPRSRGENAPAMTPAARPAGSSPLTRGKPLCRVRDTRPMGLIPAHAGKTG